MKNKRSKKSKNVISAGRSLSGNPIPHEKTLDSCLKNCGNDEQRSIGSTPKKSFEEFY